MGEEHQNEQECKGCGCKCGHPVKVKACAPQGENTEQQPGDAPGRDKDVFLHQDAVPAVGRDAEDDKNAHEAYEKGSEEGRLHFVLPFDSLF